MSDLLLTYYGDDFTGSTDVMEALATSGLRTVLFLEPPAPEELERFSGLRAAGVAGLGRSMTPAQMDEELPGVFGAMKRLGAPLFHYKVCSTFDSSPEIGSIGRAIEIGRKVFGGAYVPLLAGAPVLRRYCAFGNLFATVEGETFRLDRHPTMSCHPVTPMNESDLRRHLGRQTPLQVGLVDLLHLARGGDERLRSELARGAEVVLFDVLDEPLLAEAGRLIWESRPPFAVGSSGVEYALLAHFRREGKLAAPAPPADAGKAERLLVLSGSCSPVTDGQIGWALENGFEGVRLDGEGSERRALEALGRGRSVVLYTARGPRDPGIRDARRFGRETAERLGEAARRLVRASGVRRVAVAGGDTSGHVVRRLGLPALEAGAPLAPGSPLCRAHGGEADGLEIVLKGGQVGKIDFFGTVLHGKEMR